MFKNIIFLLFKSNYRYHALGNFGKSKTYLNIKVISLGGRFKSIIGNLFYFLKIGKFISIDGNPFLKNQKNSINIWYTGTSLKILEEFKVFDNNYVNMSNPIISEEKKIFQIYPIISQKKNFFKKPKIIFMGKLYFKPDEFLIKSNILILNKKKFLNQFSLIDNKEFWHDDYKYFDKKKIFEKYKVIKTYIREQIILSINKNFKKHFLIYGEDNNNTGLNFNNQIYDNKNVKKIYEGNICIDTGSILGSLSLHPRSIQIIESNGLLIQTKQNDSKKIWGSLNEKIIFDDIDNLLKRIELMLTNQNTFNDHLNLIYEKFKKSEDKIAKLITNIFK